MQGTSTVYRALPFVQVGRSLPTLENSRSELSCHVMNCDVIRDHVLLEDRVLSERHEQTLKTKLKLVPLNKIS